MTNPSFESFYYSLLAVAIHIGYVAGRCESIDVSKEGLYKRAVEQCSFTSESKQVKNSQKMSKSVAVLLALVTIQLMIQVYLYFQHFFLIN